MKEDSMKKFAISVLVVVVLTAPAWAQNYIGNYNSNRHDPNSIANPYGAGSPYSQDSPINRFGPGLRVYGQ
jgi:hypothetical protein